MKIPVNDWKFGFLGVKEELEKDHELALVQKRIQQEPLDKEDKM